VGATHTRLALFGAGLLGAAHYARATAHQTA
jgi:hypothetical protein